METIAMLGSLEWEKVGINAGVFLGAIVLGLVIAKLAIALLNRLVVRTETRMDDSVARHCSAPLRLIVPLLALDVVMPSLDIPSAVDDPIRHVMALLMMVGVAWLIVRLAMVVEDFLVERFRIDVDDQQARLRARRIRTQFTVFRRVLDFSVAIVTFGIALTTFQWARTIGTSMLASAGIVGLAASLAARPTIENLVAGLQIALTEPIRLEDVVIAENQWGWIEEINTTYVVVRTWDLRRLILPISYFVKTPFQNWTRHRSDLLTYIYIYLDYRMPIGPLRQELGRILEASPSWDRKVSVLEVTDMNGQTIQVRALASAADSSLAWNLQCELREKLVDFVQRNYPQFLPRARAEIGGEFNTHVMADGDGHPTLEPGSREAGGA